MTFTNKVRAGYSSITSRGGRMTKWKGQVASYAPQVGTIGVGVSSRALAVGLVFAGAMALSPQARAGTCTETSAGSGTWVCSDAEDAADTTQTIAIPADTAGALTTAAGFGVTTTSGDGIKVTSDPASAGVSLTDANASQITGYDNGVYVRHSGSGATSITLTGTVTGTDEAGIDVANTAEGSDLTISAADVAGQSDGIRARSNGSGKLSVTSTGTATGTHGNGIYAWQSSDGTDLTVNAKESSGYYRGIYAKNLGSGEFSVTSTGTATGTNGDGVYAWNSSNGSDLTVTAEDSAGGRNGIYAFNFGRGALSVTSSGTATADTANGIHAYGSAANTNLTVESADSNGEISGISAINKGSGALFVTSSGNATGTQKDGIYAYSRGTGVTVHAKDSAGEHSGIYTKNLGKGALAVTSSGTASGYSADGIYAYNSAFGTSLAIDASNSTGGANGVYVRNSGRGALSVSSSGTAVGSSKDGIHARNSSYGISLTVNTVNSAGAEHGIYANNQGSGALSVTSSGRATGTNGVGIYAFNSTNGAGLMVNAVNAKGGESGIETRSYGSGGATINLTGTATGGSGAAIDTYTATGDRAASDASVLTTINLAAGSKAEAGSSGVAIRNNEGNSVLNVADGASISGEVVLGNGSDTVNLSGLHVLDGITSLDGGSGVTGVNGTDTLNLNNGWSGSLKGSRTVNWEVINLEGGKLAFSDAGITTGMINVRGGGTLDGSNGLQATANVNVATGSYLVAGNAAGSNAMKVTGNLANAGTVQLSGAAGQHAVGDVLTVTGNYAGAGQAALLFDTQLGGSNASDQLKVGGGLSGSSLVAVSNVRGTGSLTTGDGIKLVDVAGTSSGTLTLSSPHQRIDVGAFRYQLYQGGLANSGDQDWYLRSRARDVVLPSQTIARVSQDLGLGTLGTLNERRGEQEQGGGESRVFAGLWGRLLGSDYNATLTSAAFGGSRSNGQWGGMQLGVDLWRSSGEDGHMVVGAYGGYLRSSTSDSPRSGTFPLGKTRSDGSFAGLYATYYGAGGWYADAVVQGSWLTHNASANDGTTLHTKSRTRLASLEAGKPFALAGAFKLEPQVQLIYGNSQIDAVSDSAGIANSWDIEKTLTGRTGLRLKWARETSGGGTLTLYLKGNVWRTLSGGATALTVGVSAPGSYEAHKTWAEGGVGTTFSLSPSAELFLDADVAANLDKRGRAISGRSGLRMRF